MADPKQKHYSASPYSGPSSKLMFLSPLDSISFSFSATLNEELSICIKQQEEPENFLENTQWKLWHSEDGPTVKREIKTGYIKI